MSRGTDWHHIYVVDICRNRGIGVVQVCESFQPERGGFAAFATWFHIRVLVSGTSTAGTACEMSKSGACIHAWKCSVLVNVQELCRPWDGDKGEPPLLPLLAPGERQLFRRAPLLLG